VLRYPLVLRSVKAMRARLIAPCDLMMALVSAGFALGLAGATHITASRDVWRGGPSAVRAIADADNVSVASGSGDIGCLDSLH